MRPPQPMPLRLSGMEVCHCSIWSEWENRPSGRFCPALYCILVHGFHQRADVGDEREISGFEQSLQSGQRGMQA